MTIATTRRQSLFGAGTFLTLGAMGIALPGHAIARDNLPVTPLMDLGPFYPVQRPLDDDADLTRLKGHKGRAQGEVIEVSGRVLTPDGNPHAGTVLEIWQANAAGRYDHPGDRGDAPLDPDFQGYARIATDAQGGFRFLTIKPAFYKAGNLGFLRTAHIHLDVQSKRQRLVTQLYFPAELDFLRQDKVLMKDLSLSGSDTFPPYIFAQRVAAGSQIEPGAAHWRFDVVLMS
ncbi:MAG: hypothetical protein H2055_11125 [Sphingopyxis sp.]|nr:hypothetical protein [Sphingopyxis sp.]